MNSKGKQKDIRSVRKGATKKAALQPESAILRLAKEGRLAAAGQKALQDSFQKGLAVTILENNIIYRIYPDGTREQIKQIPSTSKKYYSGKLHIS